MLSLQFSSPFGWDTEAKAKVLIAQARDQELIRSETVDYIHNEEGDYVLYKAVLCPGKQLQKNATYRTVTNLTKVAGYIPVMNVVLGIGILYLLFKSDDEETICDRSGWKARSVCMILFGPLLVTADVVKTLYDSFLIRRFAQKHPEKIEQFNTAHGHTPSYWPGHPVFCKKN